MYGAPISSAVRAMYKGCVGFDSDQQPFAACHPSSLSILKNLFMTAFTDTTALRHEQRGYDGDQITQTVSLINTTDSLGLLETFWTM